MDRLLSLFVTVQSQAKFYKTDVKCLYFKAAFKILFGDIRHIEATRSVFERWI